MVFLSSVFEIIKTFEKLKAEADLNSNKIIFSFNLAMYER